MNLKRVLDSTDGYVDLGLPSGTLWKASNEDDYYDFEEALDKFGNQLPTKKQFEELKDCCSWKWCGNNIRFISKLNGNSIDFPLDGYCEFLGIDDLEDEENFDIVHKNTSGYYWSSTPYGRNDEAYYLLVNPDVCAINHYFSESCHSVRLVK